MIVSIMECTCVHTACYSITTLAELTAWWTTLSVIAVILNAIGIALCIAALAVIFNPPNGSK